MTAGAGQLCARNRRLSVDMRDLYLWTPAARAAKELHWKPSRVRSAVARGVVRGHLRPRASGRVSAVVHREDLDRLKLDAATWMDLKAVCRYLRVGKKTVKDLMAAGRLAAVSGPLVDAHPVWQFRRVDVDAVQGLLRSASQ